ncbi:MAG TPA: RNA methyltransferase [Flavobacteriaceae bacterium]|nr:RNA methyltransferase [Flavobacteriaceae bacterium]
MLSKNNIKLIKSLEHKKYRIQHQLFVVEGQKSVLEFLKSNFQLEKIFTIKDDFKTDLADKIEIITEEELKKISFVKTPNQVLAIFKIPSIKKIEDHNLILALDSINDPGNLGTIIRLCDWFGIEQIICSKDTVDCYNPKVVQSTMGSFTRVHLIYTDLKEFISSFNGPIYGTFIEGKNIYNIELPKKALVVMGNEANGISPEIEKLITQKISIPAFGKHQETESLNVATATAIILSEFRRR